MDRPSLRVVASTSNPDGSLPAKRDQTHNRDSFFKSVQWSADGTTLFTSSFSNRICTFVLPETLLEPRETPVELTANGTLALPEPTSAIAPCPYFALEHPSTQALLTASTDHPIHLHHAFPPSPSSSDDDDDDDNDSSTSPHPNQQPPPLASFRLVKHETEAYLPVASLIWPAPGTHFIAGTTNRIAVFDVSRSDTLNPDPLLTIPTIPSTRHLAKGGGVGMRGTVSALAAQPTTIAAADGGEAGGWGWGGGGGGLLAAGTWTRSLGLYDVMRSGECVATWSVAGAASEEGPRVGGKGVLQTLWSPCGRYLVVNERGATGLLVYDLRGTHRLLGWLEGRDGRTNQRLSCDVFPGTERVGGFEVWAGTKDGRVVAWEGVGNQEGAVTPSWDWEAHGSAVGATAMHMSGSVVATCSGSWNIVDEDEEESSSDSSDESGSEASTTRQSCWKPRVVVQETSLKVWSLGASGPSESGGDDSGEGDIEP
ncbi:hypothetical protein C8A03DRAFT_34708 [Achaetomium macrosporum]|uniref:WD40 repeat-like protein n=1 Tax=Achaetomium macrosporum TaxID=79813 RepID=A0AAN7HDD5_9PEZI|nr:hypothetical protein C8A03DRAFT_34708 [Achaetomium macrosporum]